MLAEPTILVPAHHEDLMGDVMRLVDHHVRAAGEWPDLLTMSLATAERMIRQDRIPIGRQNEMIEQLRANPHGDNRLLNIRLDIDDTLALGELRAYGPQRSADVWARPPRPRTKLTARAARAPRARLVPRWR